MNTPSTLFLAGALAVLAPAVSSAQIGQLLTVNAPTGQLTLDITGLTIDDVHVTTPITMGCIEIQEGPAYDDVGKHFILTRFSLHFADFTVENKHLERPMPVTQVAAQVRDALTWWGVEEVPGAPGVYKLEIMQDNDHRYGEPVFISGAKVSPDYFLGPHNKDVPRFFFGEERVDQPITGTMNLKNRTMTATAVFKATTEIIPFVTVDRVMTIMVSGAIAAPGTRCGGTGKGD
jgi:hypothetical protein